MLNRIDPYLLVVRWPLGGIRTHLKYARTLGDPQGLQLAPHVVAFDDSLTRLLLQNLEVPPERDLTQGVNSLARMVGRIWRGCLNRQIKVVHSQGFISALLAAPAALATGKRHIISAHDLADPRVIGTNPLVHRALGLALRQAYAVHAVGQDCAATLRTLPYMRNARNIVVIENGIDVGQFTDVTPVDLRTRLGLAPRTHLIGSFGRFMPQKGFRVLVDALQILLREHPHLDPHIVALGAGDYLREEQTHVQSLGLTSRIHFLPPANNPAAWIAGCDVIAMPSLWEAYGLVAAEVLSLGIPLVASRCLGLREVITNTPAAAVSVGDAAELAAGLCSQLSDAAKTAARAYAVPARRRFDFRANACALQRLLERAHTGKRLP